MSRLRALLPILLLSLLAHTSQAASLVASVDRTRLDLGETFELTLESDDPTQFGKPDLAPLQADFDVRDTRQINHLTALGGDGPATTRWIVTLVALRAGNLSIPPLELGALHSQAITLTVLKGDPVSKRNMAPIFLDASLDQDQVYVQAQALFTLRVYHSVPLYDDSNLTPLQIADARVESLGPPRTYEKLINGVRHGVIEWRFAIYPQRSGELLIPALVFSATPAEASDSDATSTQPGKLTHVTSGQIPLEVKAKPAGYPADAPWLPARSLSIEESWSPEPDQSQVGDSLTRSITVKAEGLSSAQLPPLPSTDIKGLRRYPDQPQLSNASSDRGLLGSREERVALVPTRSGGIDLPAIDVTWWNTREDHLEHTSLAARSLQVSDSPSLAIDTPAGDVAGQSAAAAALWPWKLATLIFACTTLLGFGLWRRARSQPAIQRAAQSGPSPRTLLDDLKRASLANDPHATRQALDAWARQQPETLADMAARFVPLSNALDGLNGALYSEAGHFWQGEDLWRAIGTIPASERRQAASGDNPSLPPLYPK
jgi:hypothetical protein